MKYIQGLVLVSAPFLCLSVGAYAANQDVALEASVAAVTIITDTPTVTGSNSGNATVTSNGFTTTVAFDIDNGGGTINDSVFEASIPVQCNAGCRATITSTNGGLKDATPNNIAPGSEGSFAQRIDYQATLSEAITGFGISSTFTTNGVTTGATATTNISLGIPLAGNFIIKVDIVETPGAVLMAGDYVDVLTFSIDPN